jgi:hypothetical protein
VVVDVESQLILDADVLSGSAGDATGALAQVERVEAVTGQAVAESLGDCAYGRGETRQAFADAGRELRAKVPQESDNQGRFPKRAFVIDLEGETVTCPGGESTARFTQGQDGGKTFQFGAVCRDCPLRAHCTTAAGGRTVAVHPQEVLLQAARAAQETPEGRARLRARVVVEHRLARLGQLGIGQARYRGRRKTRCQLLLAATIANLRRTWNWAQAQAATGCGGTAGPRSGVSGGERAAVGRLGAIVEGLRRALGRCWRQRLGPGVDPRWLRLAPQPTLMPSFAPSRAGFRPHF